MVDPADVAFDPITIVLADDHALVRGGLHPILEAEDDFHVVAEAGDADEAFRARCTRRRCHIAPEQAQGRDLDGRADVYGRPVRTRGAHRPRLTSP